MQIHLKLFAGPAQRAGIEALDLDLPGPVTVAEAIAAVERAFPQIALPVGTLAAVNLAYAPLDTLLRAGDTLALIPPVSGG